MKLHLDKDAFVVLLNEIHSKTGYRLDVLEKDYYVVLILKELSSSQGDGLPAYFKGGTALYKALKTTNRFSEDIDISVDVRGCSRTQGDKRLEKASKKYLQLERIAGEGKSNRSEVISFYRYVPLFSYDKNDALQRFGRVKIEATSFTISEPVSDMEISPMIFDLASDSQKDILVNRYDVKPFTIKTISLERTFIDKLFAAEAYFRKSDDIHKAFEVAKHVYDLAILEQNEKIINLLSNESQLNYLLNIRLEEEKERLDGIPGIKPLDFIIFDNIENNKNIKKAFENMQRQYVLQEQHKMEYYDMVKAIQRIKDKLLENRAWMVQ